MQFLVRSGVFTVLLSLTAAGSAAAADIEAGKTTFKKCALRHTNDLGKNKVGPRLSTESQQASTTIITPVQ